MPGNGAYRRNRVPDATFFYTVTLRAARRCAVRHIDLAARQPAPGAGADSARGGRGGCIARASATRMTCGRGGAGVVGIEAVRRMVIPGALRFPGLRSPRAMWLARVRDGVSRDGRLIGHGGSG